MQLVMDYQSIHLSTHHILVLIAAVEVLAAVMIPIVHIVVVVAQEVQTAVMAVTLPLAALQVERGAILALEQAGAVLVVGHLQAAVMLYTMAAVVVELV
jgi:hypothetical protein